jgi:hypothetical protein
VGRDTVTHADNRSAEQRTAEVASHSELHFEHALLVDELSVDGAGRDSDCYPNRGAQ